MNNDVKAVSTGRSSTEHLLPPRLREPVDPLTVALDAFFLRHHNCGRAVEDIVDEEVETLSVICHRCDTSVVVSLGVSR